MATGTLEPMHDEHEHRDLRGGGARAAVFGVSDGLVSNVALILGIAGAHSVEADVRLAGVAGLVAGSFSMAAGEYISMRAQSELMQRELDVERAAIGRDPEEERRELAGIYVSRGVERELADELATKMMASPELALETHAREELGIDPSQTGNPFQAAVASFVAFAVGALIPLLPWFFIGGTAAVLWSVVLGAIAAIAVGTALSFFTGRRWFWSASRQLLISAVAAAVTYGVGHVIGSH